MASNKIKTAYQAPRSVPHRYTTDQLDDLVAIIQRANPEVTVSRRELQQQLLELLYAVGTAVDGSEAAAWFREARAGDLSHAEFAEQFRKIAAAEDPLDPKICFGIALTKLDYAARGRWTGRNRRRPMNRPHPLRDMTSDFLTKDEIAEVREMALHLERYHRSFVRSGHPGKVDQDALLDGIADIYIRVADLNCHPYDLPHSPKTRFITFAHGVLSPFFARTEVSKSALYNRWKRLKDAHGRPSA
jgi:hypothetical protein